MEDETMTKAVKCTECGEIMVSTRENRPYSKLPGVLLLGVEVLRCPKCGESEVVIPKPNQLGDLLASHLIEKQYRLVGPEIRFLRAHLGLTGAELARRMGVSPETVSRWENGKDAMGPVADRLLRLLVAGDMPREALARIGDDSKPLNLVVRASRAGWKEAA
jgi:putative zinc finger/helix-turn-helix YgiT family protein